MSSVDHPCELFVFVPGSGSGGSSQYELDPVCVRMAVSQLLGVGILVGALGLKLPQIFAIVSKKTVAGLSPVAVYNEVPLVLTSVAYNYLQGNPFSTYGESAFILVQNLVIALLVWKYAEPPVSAGVRLGLTAAFVAVTAVSFALPPDLQYLLPLANLPLLVAARLPQVWANYRAGSTGQLSAVTLLLSFAGAVARVFTTIQQIGWDLALLSTYLVGAALSGILIAQIFFYKMFPAQPRKAAATPASSSTSAFDTTTSPARRRKPLKAD